MCVLDLPGIISLEDRVHTHTGHKRIRPQMMICSLVLWSVPASTACSQPSLFLVCFQAVCCPRLSGRRSVATVLFPVRGRPTVLLLRRVGNQCLQGPGMSLVTFEARDMSHAVTHSEILISSCQQGLFCF